MIRVEFTRGSAELDVNDLAHYAPGVDFIPPQVALMPVMSHGDSLWSGSQAIGQLPADNREWSSGWHIIGDTEAEVKMLARELDAFIRSGTPSQPVLFEVNGNTDVGFEPFWGQYGANTKYKVVSGGLALSEYAIGAGREQGLPNSTMSLLLAPVAEGKKQLLGQAMGGVLEDTVGTKNGKSRGTIIPEATVSIITNPSFETNTTGWIAHVTGTISRVTKYKLFGFYALKIVAKAASDGASYALSGLTNGQTYTFSVYILAPAGTGNIKIGYYNGATNTITTGNGAGLKTWVRLSVTATQSGTTGVFYVMGVTQGLTLYADGAQFENKTYATPYCDGDYLGCSWGGTRHASATTRAVAYLRYPVSEVMEASQGTLRLVWKAPMAAVDIPANIRLFAASGTDAFYSRFVAASNTFNFFIGSNFITGSTLSFAAGDILIIHYVWGPGVMNIYVNGTQIATGSAFTPPALGTYLYVGSTETVGEHSNGTFLGMAVCDEMMTATEVSNDATNISAWVNGGDGLGRQLESLPYFWNKDGDWVLDNVDDTNRDNWGVAAGIMGSVEAKTEWKITPSVATKAAYWLLSSLIPYNDFLSPTTPQWYKEDNGVTDANCSGGERNETVWSGAGSTDILLGPLKPWLMGGKMHYFARMAVNTGSLTITATPFIQILTGGVKVNGDAKSITLTTTYKLFYLGSVVYEHVTWLEDYQKAVTAGITLTYTGTSHTLYSDFLMVVNGSSLRIISSSTIIVSIRLSGNSAICVGTAGAQNDVLTTRGSEINLVPDQYNVIWGISGDHNEAHVITNTITIANLYYIPRYALI